MILGLHPIDVAIILGSLLAVLIVGFVVSRGVHNEDDYFVSGRNIGAWLQFFMNFGQATDSNAAPTIATEVYRSGAGGMWIGFMTLFLSPFYWFSSVWFRRTRAITWPDLFEDRFKSRRLATFCAWFTILVTPLQLGLGNVISYKVAAALITKPTSAYTAEDQVCVNQFKEYRHLLQQLEAGQLPPAQKPRFEMLDSRVKKGEISSNISYIKPTPFYLGYTALVAAYIMLGGIKAAAVTDAIQGVLIILFSIIMIPVGLLKIGGFHALHATIPAHNFLIFGADGTGDYTWYSIAAITFASLVTLANNSQNGPSNASAADEHAVRVGLISGTFLKRFMMIAWMLCGLLAIALFPHNGISDPDNTWGDLARLLLGPGFLGLMIAGMLLGHMPAVGSYAVNFSATFTRNVYAPSFPNKSSRHYLFVAQISTLGILIASISVALFFSGVISLLTAIITFNAFFGACGFLVYYWRKITAAAVGLGAVAWILLMIVIPWCLPCFQSFRRAPSLVLRTDQLTIHTAGYAIQEDLDAHRATRLGEPLERTTIAPPRAMFFESVALTHPSDPTSPLEGLGRFNVENYILYHLGFPIHRMDGAWLMTCRWTFDGIAPIVLLMGISWLTQPRRSAVTPVSAPLASEEPDTSPAFDSGAASIATRTRVQPRPRTLDAERHRIAVFYAKMKTPVHPDPAEDARLMALNEQQPDRLDHLKLFPNTDWEFTRWTRNDYLGFFGICGAVAVILTLLWGVLQIGA